MIKTHEMKLRSEPFDKICTGEKTIEFRLCDEKRSLLQKGDNIRFSEMDTDNTVLVQVEDIITAKSFEELKEKLIEMRFLIDGNFSPADMRKYYSVEDENKYGVMGIKIKIV